MSWTVCGCFVERVQRKRPRWFANDSSFRLNLPSLPLEEGEVQNSPVNFETDRFWSLSHDDLLEFETFRIRHFGCRAGGCLTFRNGRLLVRIHFEDKNSSVTGAVSVPHNDHTVYHTDTQKFQENTIMAKFEVKWRREFFVLFRLFELQNKNDTVDSDENYS